MRLPWKIALLWVFGLLLLCVAWGAVMHAMLYGAFERWSLNLGVGIGMGGSVFVWTAPGAGIAYAITRNTTTALRTWTGLILLAFVALGIGGLKIASERERARELGKLWKQSAIGEGRSAQRTPA